MQLHFVRKGNEEHDAFERFVHERWLLIVREWRVVHSL